MIEKPSWEHAVIINIGKNRGHYYVVFFDGENKRCLMVSESSDIGKFIYQNYIFLQKGANVRLEMDPVTGTVSEMHIDETTSVVDAVSTEA
jgi:hypothetical protein